MHITFACTDLDDALNLAVACSQCDVTAIVPLPNGSAWRFAEGQRELSEWPDGIDWKDLYCVVIE